MARAWSSVRICSGLGATGMPPGRKVGIGSVSFRFGLICQVSLTELSSRRKSPTVFIGNFLRKSCLRENPRRRPWDRAANAPKGNLDGPVAVDLDPFGAWGRPPVRRRGDCADLDRKSTRLNSSHLGISYAVFCLKK